MAAANGFRRSCDGSIQPDGADAEHDCARPNAAQPLKMHQIIPPPSKFLRDKKIAGAWQKVAGQHLPPQKLAFRCPCLIDIGQYHRYNLFFQKSVSMS